MQVDGKTVNVILTHEEHLRKKLHELTRVNGKRASLSLAHKEADIRKKLQQLKSLRDNADSDYISNVPSQKHLTYRRNSI
jgi:hypothetical protein